MAQMTPDEYQAFLTEGTRTARLGSVRPDGRPHVVPLWFVLDAADLVMTTAKNSVKARNIRRDARVAVCVNDDEPPFKFVIMDGVASASEDPDERLRWATRIAERYVGPDQAEKYGRINGGEDMLLVRITPTKVRSENNETGI